jgi:hypothetical protein
VPNLLGCPLGRKEVRTKKGNKNVTYAEFLKYPLLPLLRDSKVFMGKERFDPGIG